MSSKHVKENLISALHMNLKNLYFYKTITILTESLYYQYKFINGHIGKASWNLLQ